jgi:recombination protein RecA
MLALARVSHTSALARNLRMFSVKPRGKKPAKSEADQGVAESSPSPSVATPTSSGAIPMDSGKRRALDTAMKQIEQQFGKGAIMRLGARPDNSANIPTFSTGSIGLDMALGCGGVPKGRVIEVYGPEASGKTTLALHIIAQAQKVGGSCAFIDAEHALDANYAQRLGIDLDNLLVSQPDSGEQALEMCDTLVRSGSVDLVVIDSVAALVPKAEIEGEMGDSHMALQARLMSQALRKLTAHLSKHNTTLLFINQIRSKVFLC